MFKVDTDALVFVLLRRSITIVIIGETGGGGKWEGREERGEENRREEEEKGQETWSTRPILRCNGFSLIWRYSWYS